MKATACLALCLGLIPVTVFAGPRRVKITLKDGRVITGALVSGANRSYRVKRPDGTIVIAESELKRLEFLEEPPLKVDRELGAAWLQRLREADSKALAKSVRFPLELISCSQRSRCFTKRAEKSYELAAFTEFLRAKVRVFSKYWAVTAARPLAAEESGPLAAARKEVSKDATSLVAFRDLGSDGAKNGSDLFLDREGLLVGMVVHDDHAPIYAWDDRGRELAALFSRDRLSDLEERLGGRPVFRCERQGLCAPGLDPVGFKELSEDIQDLEGLRFERHVDVGSKEGPLHRRLVIGHEALRKEPVPAAVVVLRKRRRQAVEAYLSSAGRVVALVIHRDHAPTEAALQEADYKAQARVLFTDLFAGRAESLEPWLLQPVPQLVCRSGKKGAGKALCWKKHKNGRSLRGAKMLDDLREFAHDTRKRKTGLASMTLLTEPGLPERLKRLLAIDIIKSLPEAPVFSFQVDAGSGQTIDILLARDGRILAFPCCDH